MTFKGFKNIDTLTVRKAQRAVLVLSHGPVTLVRWYSVVVKKETLEGGMDVPQLSHLLATGS